MKTNTAEIIPPTPERGQHDEIEAAIDGRTGREEIKGLWRLKDATQIDKYWRQGKLGQDGGALRDIGNRYARLVYLGCLGPRFAALSIGRVASGAGGESQDRIEAEITVIETDRKIGPYHASIMRAVCVEGWGAHAWATEWYRARGWGKPHSREGIQALVSALTETKKAWGWR